MAKSRIEWTDEVWNPVVGCTRASAGCDNCYAVRMSHRLENMGQAKYKGLTVVNGRGDRHFNGVVRCVEEDLLLPLRWKKPRRCFVNSMSDLFHREVPFDYIDKVFAVMALCPQHTFQVLTKRPERMAEYFASEGRAEAIWNAVCAIAAQAGDFEELGLDAEEVSLSFDRCPNWVWLGTSCENQQTADERIPNLLKCPAAVRFISCEPLIGPIDLQRFLFADCDTCDGAGVVGDFDPQNEEDCSRCGGSGKDEYSPLEEIHWIISGGESGPGARPMHPDWARSLRDQCNAVGVPFLFKQWGEWAPGEAWDGFKARGRYNEARFLNGEWQIDKDVPASEDEHIEDAADVYRIGKHRAGRHLDGRTWDEFPEVVRG